MDTKIYKDYLGPKLTEEEIVACIAQTGDEWCSACGCAWKNHYQRCNKSYMPELSGKPITQDQLWAKGEMINQLIAENQALKIKIQEYEQKEKEEERKREKARIHQILVDADDVVDSIGDVYPFGARCIASLIDEFNKLYQKKEGQP
jgi:hypothetical protein